MGYNSLICEIDKANKAVQGIIHSHGLFLIVREIVNLVLYHYLSNVLASIFCIFN